MRVCQQAIAEKNGAHYFRKAIGLDEFMKIGTVVERALSKSRDAIRKQSKTLRAGAT